MTRSYPQRPFAVPADATEVVLVRHGASQPIVPGEPFALVGGHSDPPLAPEGEAQAIAVAERLRSEPLAALFVTTLQRTGQTAAPLASTLGLEPVVVPELREVHLGEWEGGELRVRFEHHDPLIARIFGDDRWDIIPGAESMESLGTRVRAGVERIVAQSGPGVSVGAVLHGGVISELCSQATGARRLAFAHVDNASVSRLVVMGNGRWLLRSFNDIAHLVA